MTGNATQTHQKFLGRIGEDLIEYLFLRTGYKVMRCGREVIELSESGKIISTESLSPDFHITKGDQEFLIEVTVSPDGQLVEEKKERLRAQCKKWPYMQIILVWAAYPEGTLTYDKDFNPFEAWSREEKEWVLLCPENYPFFPTQTAVNAAIKRWKFFLEEPHRSFYE